ncbi:MULTISPECIES: ATP-binding SpoIIE family protein phosphatase [Streptomyces]|uniref:protein-serine/threonine phosphatase n=1 Tax=Streptomyces viridochromogenes TaxID=1938 RepID=A0A0L8LFD2_STRVR|nr:MULTISPECIES: SpoIIE family protein phosphatase [Streptomyces]KOG36837.1 protein kinase [Streptomyces viridochromogenes]
MTPGSDDPLDAGHSAGLVVDARGTILRCTPAAESLLRRSAQDLHGRRVRDLLAVPARWRTVLEQRDGPVWEGRAELAPDGGGEVEFRVLPLVDGEQAEQAREFLVLGVPRVLVSQWRQGHAFMRELFLQDRIGLAVLDNELRLVRTNTHLLPYSGVPGDLYGVRMGDFLREEGARVIDARLREVLATGIPLVGLDVEVHTRVDPGPGRTMALSAFRLQGAKGLVMGVTALFVDVTEERLTRSRLDLLHRATTVLSTNLSAEETTRDLVDVLVPALADVAVVDVAEAVFTHEQPAPELHHDHALRRTAVAGATPGTGPGASPGGLATGAVVAVDTGGVLSGRVWSDGAEEGVEPPDALGSAHGMSAWLRARGSLLGRIRVGRGGDRPPFTGDDLALLEQIASRAALVVDNARRYARERNAAVGLQRSLLPSSSTDTPTVHTASVYLPTDTATGVSGDWFDVIPLSSARVALVVGDVVGHGLQATATMARLRTAVRTLADLDLEPDELLTHLDDLVSQFAIDVDVDGGQATRPPGTEIAFGSFGATCLYMTYDPVTRRCLVASAGHPPPALVAPDGGVAYVDLSPGPPLGVGGLPFEPVEVEVADGSVLALYTDGLIERGHADLDEGMAAFRHALSAALVPGRPLEEVGPEVVRELVPGPLSDDVTLLLASVRGVPAHDSAAWTFAADPSVVAEARASVLAQLSRWGLDELAFTTELVASELVTNAIRYAGGPVGLRLIRAASLICEVSDRSGTQPRMRRAHATEEGGRGLFLIAQLTDRWGSRYTRSGKTIWTEQALPPRR